MRIEAAMLANYAEPRESMLHVISGGWEHISAAAFPAAISTYIAGVIARDPEEMGENRTVKAIVEAPTEIQRQEVAQFTLNTLHVGTAEGVPARTSFALPLQFRAPAPGVYLVALEYEGERLCSLAFEIRPAA